MTARLEDGWIRVPYDGPDLAVIDISIGEGVPVAWQPAFLHTVGAERVAQVRPQSLDIIPNPKVWLRVNGSAQLIGRLGEGVPEPGRRRRG